MLPGMTDPIVAKNWKARLAEKAVQRRKSYRGQKTVVLASKGDDLTTDLKGGGFSGMNPRAGGNHGQR
jgi:hypothetical protein